MKKDRLIDRSAEEYEIRNGKPHLGVWFCNAVYHFPSIINHGEHKKWAESFLQKWVESISLEKRHIQYIDRPPYYGDTLTQNGSIAVKLLIWGRAWKVRHLCSKGRVPCKKIRVNGRYRKRKPKMRPRKF